MDEVSQIFDRIFKRIFSFSDMAVTNLINGLFGTNHPPDSKVEYSNRESTKANLSHTYSDLFIVINQTYHYHLEAQMYHDNTIVMRVFEYGFYHALETSENNCTLRFPEPVVIYSREATSQVDALARIFGDCREGQIPRCLHRGI